MGPPHALSATKLLSLFCFYILLATQAADAKIQRDKWEENYRFKSPDCHKKLAIAINGRTTGPQSSRNKATLLSTEGLMAHKVLNGLVPVWVHGGLASRPFIRQ